jgi:nitrate/nitrite-specific signal transduction histidine kinase
VLFVLLATVFGGVQVRVRGNAARNLQLETQVVERTRALEQKTDELWERTRDLEDQTWALKRRGRELAALYRAEERMHRHLHLDQVLQALVDVTVDILQADESAVLVWDERQKRLVTTVARGFSLERMAHLTFIRGEGITGHIAVSGEDVAPERLGLNIVRERAQAIGAELRVEWAGS